MQIEENCGVCYSKEGESSSKSKSRKVINSFGLDDSQKAAVSSCVALRECCHRNSVKLIWGPPGTGKTKTISSLVFTLLRLKCRTVTCAPTNVAILGVAKKLISCLNGTLGHEGFGLGDVVLFGNGERMKIDEHQDLHDVFLDHRIAELASLFAPLSGWKAVVNEMISFLQAPRVMYLSYLTQIKVNDDEGSESEEQEDDSIVWTFEEFFENKFVAIKARLVLCIKALCTHMPTSCLRSNVVKKVTSVSSILRKLETCLKRKEAFIPNEEATTILEKDDFRSLKLRLLKLMNFLSQTLSLPECTEHYLIKEFCLKNACLIFCTVSSSAKLHQVKEITPFEMVIIDEAAQVKECESSIPLQLPGIRHAILVGDEKQLPAMVISKVRQTFSTS